MTTPTDMGRDQLAHTLHSADTAIYPAIRSWDDLTEDSRSGYLQLADVLLGRTIVLARTRGGPTTAADYLAASATEAMDQATHHAADGLRRARELGTVAYHQTSVTGDEQTLVQMLAQAWVSGHRTASHAAQGALDDIARLQADADRGMQDRAEQGRTVMVELPDETGAAAAEAAGDEVYAELADGRIVLVELAHLLQIASLGIADARVLVPQILALVRDHDQAAADPRARQIARFAERAHVDLCGGTAENAADCHDCQTMAVFVIDRWAAQEAADADAA